MAVFLRCVRSSREEHFISKSISNGFCSILRNFLTIDTIILHLFGPSLIAYHRWWRYLNEVDENTVKWLIKSLAFHQSWSVINELVHSFHFLKHFQPPVFNCLFYLQHLDKWRNEEPAMAISFSRSSMRRKEQCHRKTSGKRSLKYLFWQENRQLKILNVIICR